MKTNDLLRLALLNLRRRKTRTFLTVLGVVVGTACIVLMLSVGLTNYAELQGMVSGRASLTEIRISAEGTPLSQSDVAEMTGIQHVLAASPLLRLPGRLRTGSYEAYVDLTGIEPEVLELQFAQGGLFSAGTAAPELVIGGDATRNFVDPQHPPDYDDWQAYEGYEPPIRWLEADMSFLFGYGDTKEDEGESWYEDPGIRVSVSGVTQRTDNMDAGGIYVSLSAARRLLADYAAEAEELGIGAGRYTEALVRVDSIEHVEEVLGALRERGFQAYSDVEYVNETRAELSRQLLQLLLIGLVSLSVSAIGIANTMYAGVLERRRDIGVMKVLGMKRRRIRRLFVVEAACVGLFGGVIGLAIAGAAVWAVNLSLSSGALLGMSFAEGTRIAIPLWVALGAVALACATGVLAGLWPAAKAARLSPLEAMRGGS